MTDETGEAVAKELVMLIDDLEDEMKELRDALLGLDQRVHRIEKASHRE